MHVSISNGSEVMCKVKVFFATYCIQKVEELDPSKSLIFGCIYRYWFPFVWQELLIEDEILCNCMPHQCKGLPELLTYIVPINSFAANFFGQFFLNLQGHHAI